MVREIEPSKVNMERLKIFLMDIWPRVYRIINSILYFLITTLKSAVKIAVGQIRNI